MSYLKIDWFTQTQFMDLKNQFHINFMQIYMWQEPQKSLKQVVSYTFDELAHFLKIQKIVFCKYLGIQ
jgi:hypothetical protein